MRKAEKGFVVVLAAVLFYVLMLACLFTFDSEVSQTTDFNVHYIPELFVYLSIGIFLGLLLTGKILCLAVVICSVFIAALPAYNFSLMPHPTWIVLWICFTVSFIVGVTVGRRWSK